MNSGRLALIAGLLLFVLVVLGVVLLRNSGSLPDSFRRIFDRWAGSEENTETAAAGHDTFSVHFIDVGQADATLILCEGESLLIDGGNQEDAPAVLSYLRQQDVERLDSILCTHAHEDHCGGLAQIIREAASADTQVLAPQADSDNWFFHDFAKTAQAKGCAVRVPAYGESFEVGSARAQIVGPVRPAEEILKDEYGLVNNTSLMVRVEYEGCTFLFCGDAQWQEEREVVEAAGQQAGAGAGQQVVSLEADVLKPGHHGSANATSYAFLMAVNPSCAVISCGSGNEYGHPHEDTLDKLAEAGVQLYRTDLQGTIVCRLRDGKPDFAVEKDPGAAVYLAPPLPELIPEDQ
ncbi:MAG: MBL fold metallo-hydrolase [Lachnospiraceae bacterium]|nr:MBL fold metallo-hydrolase [Lachnospiraceae bacterium]